MKVLIVYYHPEPRSFNHALYAVACNHFKQKKGFEVKTSDLNAMNFDSHPGRNAYKNVKDPEVFKQQIEEMHAAETRSFADFVEAEMRKVEWCDLMLWQFPLWWFSLPSPLKGWVERVFAMKRLYDGAHIYDTGFCKGKKAVLSLTTGAPASAYRTGGMNGDLLTLLRPVQHGILEFAGFSVLSPHVVFAPAHLTPEQRKQALDDFSRRLENLHLEAPVML